MPIERRRRRTPAAILRGEYAPRQRLIESELAEHYATSRFVLGALGDAMTAAVDGMDMLRYSELNALLHSSVRQIARHGTATKIIEQLHAQMVRHQFRGVDGGGPPGGVAA